MSKGFGEKLKILYLRDYLLRCSDEKHPVTVQDMQDALAEKNILAERKSIYRDLNILGKKPRETAEAEDEDWEDFPENYGMNIVQHKGNYYVSERTFTLQELKLLVDMLQTSNSITAAKTQELINKITGLASVYEAKQLKRTVYVRNRVKTMNESVFFNVDEISEAINGDKVLRFQYFRYNAKKEKELRHGGKIHVVSPFALIWVDQNYYLLGFSHEYGEIRPFRVDRMTGITLSAGPREGKREFEKIDMATFTTKVFHMYTGKNTRVILRFRTHLADTVIDRFGEDIMMHADGNDWCTANVEVAVSPQFYGWLAGFGPEAEVIGPPEVRRGMAEHLRSAAALYDAVN